MKEARGAGNFWRQALLLATGYCLYLSDWYGKATLIKCDDVDIYPRYFGHHFTHRSPDRGLIESLGCFSFSNVLVEQISKSRLWHLGNVHMVSI